MTMGNNLVSFLKNRRYNKNVPWFRKFLSLVFLGLTLLVILAFWSNFLRLKEAERKIEEKRKYLEDLEKENKSIEKRLKEITSGDYIEKQLRDNLAMAKKGEIVVILPDEETLRSLVPKIDYEKNDSSSLPNFRKWLIFFKL